MDTDNEHDLGEDDEVIEITVPEGWALFIIENSCEPVDLDLTQWDVEYQD